MLSMAMAGESPLAHAGMPAPVDPGAASCGLRRRSASGCANSRTGITETGTPPRSTAASTIGSMRAKNRVRSPSTYRTHDEFEQHRAGRAVVFAVPRLERVPCLVNRGDEVARVVTEFPSCRADDGARRWPAQPGHRRAALRDNVLATRPLHVVHQRRRRALNSPAGSRDSAPAGPRARTTAGSREPWTVALAVGFLTMVT